MKKLILLAVAVMLLCSGCTVMNQEVHTSFSINIEPCVHQHRGHR